MAKISAEGVVSDATLSDTPEPVEPEDLTPVKDDEGSKVEPVPIEDDGKPAAKPVRRTAGRKS